MTITNGNIKRSILLVDDNPNNLKLLAEILTENGFQVRASNSGRYALKSIKLYPPDLILLDIRMPEMDGYEVCRQLKADPLFANIPVIFISALKEEESKVMGFEVGGVDYITKPFQSQEILARVRTHLTLSRMQQHLEEMIHKRTSEFQAERKRFQKLFELASDPFFIHDLNGTIIDVNRQACKSLGYTHEELLHLKVPEIEIDVSQESVKGLCNRADKGEHIIIEERYRRKDGSTFPVEVSLGLFQEQEPKLLLAISRDISERKLAEEELRQYGHIVSCSSDMMAFMDRKFVYIAANQAYLEAFNKSREDLISHAASEVFGVEYFEKVIKVNAERCLAGKVVNFQAWFEFPAYGKRYMDVTYSPYTDESNEIKGFVINARNMTEYKKMEEALSQSEKLKSVGTITAGIAHDFNNILAIISGKVQLLEMDNESSKELTDELSIIMRAIKDGAEISGRILEFAKTEKDIEGYVSCDIRELLRQSIDFTMPRWKNEAQAKGMEYKMDEGNMKSISSIMCNPSELREVFINIINNALDAMPEGGSLSFNTWSGDETVFISITDTGEGMSAEVIKNIFVPFFSTKGVLGTGLGMSMAYGIITKHGGNIEVESDMGKGTTFTLQFPITNERASLMVTPEPEQK